MVVPTLTGLLLTLNKGSPQLQTCPHCFAQSPHPTEVRSEQSEISMAARKLRSRSDDGRFSSIIVAQQSERNLICTIYLPRNREGIRISQCHATHLTPIMCSNAATLPLSRSLASTNPSTRSYIANRHMSLRHPAPTLRNFMLPRTVNS